MNIDERPCPFCAEPIKTAAIVCRHCKTNLAAPQGYAPPPPMPTRRGMPGWAIALIVCVAIVPLIAIIAAIAIPGLLSAKEASNERNASGSLKTVATAEADFRANDRDNNRVNDFWTGDIAGLYCIDNSSMGGSYTAPIRLIEISVALADIAGDAPKGCTVQGTNNYSTPVTDYGVQSSKAGYWYMALVEDRDAGLENRRYKQNTGGADENNHNTSRFGAAALPEVYGSSGKWVYLINEGNTMFKQDYGSDVLTSGSPPPTLTGRFDGNWPSDSDLRSWTKMD